MHSIRKSWKDPRMANSENIKILIFQGHHLIRNHQIYCLKQMNSKDIYSILIESDDSQLYYKMSFRLQILIYVLPRIATKDSRLRLFQYKLLNNVLYLNKMLFKFRKIELPLCVSCKMRDETLLHLFFAQKQNFGTN